MITGYTVGNIVLRTSAVSSQIGALESAYSRTHQTKCDVSQYILSQIVEVIKSDVVLQNQVH